MGTVAVTNTGTFTTGSSGAITTGGDFTVSGNASLANNGCTVWIGRYIKFASYNNNYVAGCSSIGVTPPGIITTTTTTSTSTSSSNRGKVLE